MYARNCGSNWPSSGAAIACSTRGWALMGPEPISSRSGGCRSSNSSAMRMVLEPVPRDVDAARDPDFLASHVPQKPVQRREAAGTADEPAVQADRHHAPAFGVENIECILQIRKKIVAGIETLRRSE